MENKNYWKTELSPSSSIRAGARGIWTLDMYPARDLKAGDIIRINPDYLRAKWDIGEFFFTTAEDCAIEHRRIYPSMTNGVASLDYVLEGKITDGCIKKGELVRLYLGNYSCTGKDTFAPKLAVTDAQMKLLFKKSSTETFETVAEIHFDIIPAETAKLSVHFSSPTEECPDICISSLDIYGNITDCDKNVIVFAKDNAGKKVRLAAVSLENGKACIPKFKIPSFELPAFLYAELEKDENIASEKVPFWPGFAGGTGYNIYFGEMHLHSSGSHNDGMNSPEFVYDYARYVSGMAFCGITDHVGMIQKDFWLHQRKTAKQYYRAGSFVPILGYEWDSDSQKGHTGVFVKGDLKEIVKGDSIKELWQKLEQEGYAFFTRPNHVNTVAEHLPLLPIEKLRAWKNYDWSQHDDRYQPLVEIVNPRGSSEKEEFGHGVLRKGYGSSIASALGKGFHIGFCGGSDDHTGRPGRTPESNWIIKKGDLHTGITAVLVKKIDKDSLWDALTNRQTYATTGAKILLDFRLDELIAGEKKAVKDKNKTVIHMHVVGTDIITNIAVIRNGEILREYTPNLFVFEKTFNDNDMDFSLPCSDGYAGHTYYYVRVTQRDGHRAWSSPIFYCRNQKAV